MTADRRPLTDDEGTGTRGTVLDRHAMKMQLRIDTRDLDVATMKIRRLVEAMREVEAIAARATTRVEAFGAAAAELPVSTGAVAAAAVTVVASPRRISRRRLLGLWR